MLIQPLLRITSS
jgi:transcription initiation factor TFIIB